jgi:hypothetical protein
MPNEYFEMLDDMKLQAARLLGDLLTPDGAEVMRWDCSFGKHVDWTGPLAAKVVKDGRPLDLSSNTWRTWIVSSKAKQVIEDVAPDSVQYLPLNINNDCGLYFVANIVRRVACLDEKLTHVERRPLEDKKRPDLAGKISMLLDLHILPERANGEHLFRLEERPVHVVLSRQLKEALEQAAVSGIKFQSVTATDVAEFRKQFAERQRQRNAM